MGIEQLYRKLGSGVLEKLKEDSHVFKLSSYRGNPIIKPEDFNLVWRVGGIKHIGSIFNGGATIYGNKIILAPRCHREYVRKSYYNSDTGITRYYMEKYISKVCILESMDGIHFRPRGPLLKESGGGDFEYGIEDVRIINFLDEEYILIGCGKKIPPFMGSGGDRIAIYTTKDFRDIRYRGIINEFDSRNAVIFPEYIDGRLYMIFRFHPNIHIDKLKYGIEQLYNPRIFRSEWLEIYRNRGRNILLKAGEYPHEDEKIGAGPPPIATKEGWLLIYHSVGYIDKSITKLYGLDKPIVRGYSISAALLDINDPRKVLYRTKLPIYIPSKPWEYEGNDKYPIDIPYVIFPTGLVNVNGRLAIYAGAGDKYMILLSADLDALIDYIVKYGERYAK